jgi:hypothetical protein
MKLLIASILLLANSLPFGFQSIGNLAEAFESCDIDTETIEAIVITTNGEEAVSVEIASVLSTEVIDVLESDAEGRFHDIPEGTMLSTIGLIVFESDEPSDWASFGVVENEELERYWLILFPSNIFVSDSISCGAFEILLEGAESDT